MAGWLRSMINNYRKMPMTREHAIKIRKILASIYFMTAWTTLGYTIYYFFLQRNGPTPEEAQNPTTYYAKLLNLQNVRVIKVKSFDDIEQYTVVGQPPRTRGFPRLQKQDIPEKNRDEDLELLVEETSSL